MTRLTVVAVGLQDGAVPYVVLHGSHAAVRALAPHVFADVEVVAGYVPPEANGCEFEDCDLDALPGSRWCAPHLAREIAELDPAFHDLSIGWTPERFDALVAAVAKRWSTWVRP